MGSLFAKIKEAFFEKKLEMVLVGLEGAGKSTFCNYLEMGENKIEEPPTVGLNVKIVKKGNVVCKVWDIGGTQTHSAHTRRVTVPDHPVCEC
jgi:ADP-ribosylation factor-like protein 8